MNRLLLICTNAYLSSKLFFFNVTAPTEIYTLSLHDALPIFRGANRARRHEWELLAQQSQSRPRKDRTSTRLNSSHVSNSYAGFCLKNKNQGTITEAFSKKDPPAKHYTTTPTAQ